MKGFWANPFIRSRYPLAMGAGLVLAAAFPPIGIAGFAWVAPGLMVAVAGGRSGGERFRIGYVAGLAHYLAMLHWLLLIPFRWHGVPIGPAAGWLALGGFLALYPATWVWLVCPVQSPKSEVRSPKSEVRSQESGSGGQELEGSGMVSGLHLGMEGYTGLLPRSWVGRAVWAVSGAAVWVALEMVVARVLGGFPWDLLGVSQYGLVPLIQIASVTGVYGVSFVVAWVSLALLSGALMLIRRPTVRSIWVGEIFLPVLVVAVIFNFGLRQLREAPPQAISLQVILVQPSIPQTLIWDPRADDTRFQDLLRLTEQALTNQADILIWPESAVPKLLRYDTNTFSAITGLAQRHHVWMIVGSDDAEPSPNAANPDVTDYSNSSFLVSPQGQLVERYLKRNLVVFGEYIPLQRWLPFLKYFTPVQGGFTAGTGPVPFDLPDLHVKTSVLICFEDIFPQLARGDVRPDTDFLVNITNDGWFGRSAAQWQQAITALFRTVENGVPLIRCCNNGLTCWIDAQGRMRDVFRDDRGTIYGAGFKTVKIPVMAPGETHAPTFYTRHGDWFGWGCVAVAVLVLVRRLTEKIGQKEFRQKNLETEK